MKQAINMVKEISLQNTELNHFLAEERNKVLAYLRKTFTISDDALNDIYQEASVALFMNIRDGKLVNLTSTLSTYFLRVCINQTLKFIGKQKKVVPLFDDSRLTNKDSFRPDKIDELYQLCTEDEDAEKDNTKQNTEEKEDEPVGASSLRQVEKDFSGMEKLPEKADFSSAFVGNSSASEDFPPISDNDAPPEQPSEPSIDDDMFS